MRACVRACVRACHERAHRSGCRSLRLRASASVDRRACGVGARLRTAKEPLRALRAEASSPPFRDEWLSGVAAAAELVEGLKTASTHARTHTSKAASAQARAAAAAPPGTERASPPGALAGEHEPPERRRRSLVGLTLAQKQEVKAQARSRLIQAWLCPSCPTDYTLHPTSYTLHPHASSRHSPAPDALHLGPEPSRLIQAQLDHCTFRPTISLPPPASDDGGRRNTHAATPAALPPGSSDPASGTSPKP